MWRVLIGVVLAVVPFQTAHPWGDDGHSIVAEIAQRRLSDDARKAVDTILNHASLASVSSWADDIKFTERPDTKHWHFVDIPLAEHAYNPATQCKHDACVIAALTRLKPDLLCGKDPKAKLDALRFAVHFVGDIHQPLHTVKEEVGGNTIPVMVNFCGLKQPGCTPSGQKTNLHEVWDETLIDSTFFNWGAYVDRLENGWLKTPEAQAVSGEAGSITDWALQAHTLAPGVWRTNDAVLDESYYNAALPVLDKQLGSAGLRLARYLNEAYAPPACPAQ